MTTIVGYDISTGTNHIIHFEGTVTKAQARNLLIVDFLTNNESDAELKQLLKAYPMDELLISGIVDPEDVMSMVVVAVFDEDIEPVEMANETLPYYLK